MGAVAHPRDHQGKQEMLIFFLFLGQAFSMSLTERESTTSVSPTMYPTTHPKVPCNVHICTEDEEGLFTEGPCENTFCQCEMGHGWLQTCQEGTYFDEVMCVCNWPWNIPGCEDDLDGRADLELGLQEHAQALQTPHRPQPRCTKLAILP